MNPETDKIFKVLQEIQSRVPANWLKAVVKEVPYTPHLKELVEKAIGEESVPEAKKEELRMLLASGDLDKSYPVEDPKIAKLIDGFVAREINKAKKDGRLPKRVKDIKGLREIYAKVHSGSNQGKDKA